MIAGHKGIDRLVVGDAGAGGVADHHIPRAIGVEQAGDAQARIAAEGERVDEVVVDAAVDHIDLPHARGGAHVDGVVVHGEVAALDQGHAHQPRQIGVLVIGRVVDAGVSTTTWGLGRQSPAMLFSVRQQQVGIALDRPHARAAEGARKGAARGLAVGQHVADAGRHAEVVLQHEELARRPSDEVAAADVHIGLVRHIEVLHLPAIGRRAEDEVARHDAGGEDLLVAIDVGQEEVKRAQALDQALLDLVPLVGGNDPREEVGGDDLFGGTVGAVDGEGDALQ